MVNKPKGRMSAYTFFVQTCREEHRKKHPTESVTFTEFSKRCSTRWREMSEKEKLRFVEMANKDKIRYEKEMTSYVPVPGDNKRKKKKDPNAPKRPLSAFFLFCADERPKVRTEHPQYSVGEIAKELGERWSNVSAEVKRKYEERTLKEKARYQKEMKAYLGGAPVSKKSRGADGQANSEVIDGDEDVHDDVEEEEEAENEEEDD